ncbi:MAG TPA: hypothetical protein VGN86_05010 [Pyrinomonadaceae bacterium]|jgi:hypothetical protein|nr:hypothetical protein [Pyrinomonadaceae bacterium]
MSEPLTYEFFHENLDSTFTLVADNGAQLDLKLVEVSEHLVSSAQERFAIVFLGPNDAFLGQGTRHFKHGDELEFDLFLVPIGRDDTGTKYEAVFNRFVKKADVE